MSVATTIKVYVPSALRAYCDGAAELSLPAASVRDALAVIAERHPSLYQSTCDETGAVRRHVNVFVNKASIRALRGLDTALAPGDVITILPSVSGG